jgi:hypothetical protein
MQICFHKISQRPQTLSLFSTETKSIELFIEDQAFSLSYDLAPSPPPPTAVSKLSLSFSVFPGRAYRGGRGEGVGRSQIIRRRGSLVLYKSFNTLCPERIEEGYRRWLVQVDCHLLCKLSHSRPSACIS